MPRPRIQIDLHQLEGLIRLGSPVSEIADFLGVSESTLRRHGRAVLAKARAMRRMSLRQLQWAQAKDGNVPMLIFLGKEELGQGREDNGPEEKMIVRRMVKRTV